MKSKDFVKAKESNAILDPFKEAPGKK